MQYKIFEGNMERLRKKMTHIQNKCKKYGCEFRFAEVGEEFREVKDPATGFVNAVRFVIVEAEGHAVINDWQFVAEVEHTDKGNIIQGVCGIEVPERYYTTPPICEHCQSNRARKNTYIVMNTKTGEFKQVGKSCLKDFTNGMSAEGVAQYMSAFESLIEGEAPCEGWWRPTYVNTREFLCYAAETIRHFGYVKRGNEYDYDYDPTVRTTRDRAVDYYLVKHGLLSGYWHQDIVERRKREIEASGFDAESQEATEEADAAYRWVLEQPENSNYMHNLKTVCALDYVTMDKCGLLVSLFPAYNRELEKQAERKRIAKAEANSDWVGEVGQRLDIKVASWKCMASWENQFGMGYLYKIVDADGNVYTWKTSRCIDGAEKLKGTVKAHSEFRGTKQTELTRCKAM